MTECSNGRLDNNRIFPTQHWWMATREWVGAELDQVEYSFADPGFHDAGPLNGCIRP